MLQQTSWNDLYKVLYMSSSFWLLGVESCDFSHAEKERNASKAQRIHKMTIIFTQNSSRLSFCEFAQFYKHFFLSQLEKNHVTQLPTAKN